MIRLKLHGALINYGDTKEHECPVFEVVLERGGIRCGYGRGRRMSRGR